MHTRLVTAAFAALVLCPLTAAAQGDARDCYAEALQAYEIGRYQDALSWLSVAAEDNDVRAQQMLGLMYVYGEALYGPEVPRNPGLGKAWLYRAEAQGSAVARFTLSRLDKGQQAPAALAVVNRDASGE